MKKDKKTTVSFPDELKKRLEQEGMSIQNFLDKCLEEKYNVRLNGWRRNGNLKDYSREK